MRYPVPHLAPSAILIDTLGEQYGVLIQNAGAVDIWVEFDTGAGSVNIDKRDAGTGAPLNGIKIPANSWPPLRIDKFNGRIFAASAAQDGSVDIWVFPNC